MAKEDVEGGGITGQDRNQKLSEKNVLENWLHQNLNEILNDHSINDGLSKLESFMKDPKLSSLLEQSQEIQKWDRFIPEPISLITSANLQSQLRRMLENSFHYQRYLECFLTRFEAFNEKIGPELYTPLHFAVRQQNKVFINWLLAQSSIDVNARNSQCQTALFLLCEAFQQGRDVNELILLLLENGANFNVYCGCKMLPFELLMSDESEENRKFLEECVDTHRFGAIAIGKTNVELKQRFVGFYGDSEDVKVTVELLEVFLGFGEHERFEKELAGLTVSEDNVRDLVKVLLHTAVKLNLEKSVKRIVEIARSQIFRVESGRMVHQVELKGLLKKACASENVNTFKLLLNSIPDKKLVNEDPILIDTLNMAQGEKRDNMLQCANLLIKSGKVDYSVTDVYGNTALHCAVKSGFKDVTLNLLHLKNNFLGARNKDNLTPLDYADRDFWKHCFDRCMMRVRFASNPDDDEIRLNYNSFIPYDFDVNQPNCCQQYNCWSIFEEASAINLIGKQKQSIMTETDPLKVISRSKELQTLLLHPFVQTFIQIKWRGMNKWCYLNMIFTLLTLCCFSWYSWNTCNASQSLNLQTLLTYIGLGYMILRELVQFHILRSKYLQSLENLLDILIIIATTLTLNTTCNPILSSLIVIAFVRQLTVLIGSLPSRIATFMHMFNTITYNFLLSFLLFIPWLAAFTYCFYLTYSVRTSHSTATNESFNSFGTLTDAALKTLVMATGEFDAASLDLNGGKMILLVLFIFFVSFVFLNLINGLAVSDITEIRRQSELIGIRKKVTILYRNDRAVRSTVLPGSFLAKHHCEVIVKPKEMRKILVLAKNQGSKDHQYGTVPQEDLNNKKAMEWEVLPIIPKWIHTQEQLLSGLFLNCKIKIPLFYTLEEHSMAEVLKTVDQTNTDDVNK